MAKPKKESTAVAAIAPSGSQRLSAVGQRGVIPDKKRKKAKKTLMKTGKQRNQPKEFKTAESTTEKIREAITQSLFDIILEQEDFSDDAMDVFDNVGRQMQLSSNYCKMFVSDALKLGGDGMKFNMKRAMAETKRMSQLANNIETLIKKIYAKRKNEDQAPEEPEVPEEVEMPTDEQPDSNPDIPVRKI